MSVDTADTEDSKRNLKISVNKTDCRKEALETEEYNVIK
jgi:hypothetical protein